MVKEINENSQEPLTKPPRVLRDIKWIVIHCSATRTDHHYTYDQLRRDHVEYNHWKDIGYHYYITQDGTLYSCRPESKVGAHVKGFNTKSIGVCYEGGLTADCIPADTRTAEQLVTLDKLLRELKARYPQAEIVGHRDLLRYGTKVCPCFNARHYYKYIP